MKNKILITGAAGFIGSHLVDCLLGDGVKNSELRLMVAPWDTLENINHKRVEIIVGDIRNKEDVAYAMEGMSIVYHLASKTGYDGGSYEYFKDTIVEGTKNIVDQSIQEKVKKLIYFSTAGVYGMPATSGDVVNLNESTKPIPSEGYGQSKLEAENYITDNLRNSTTKYIILRPTTVYGPRDKGGLTQLIRVLKKRMYLYIGNGNNKMDYIFVKDVAKVARYMETSPINNQSFIVGTRSPKTQKELVQTICLTFGLKTPIFSLPTWIALFVSIVVKYACFVFRIRPIFFPNRVRVLSSNFYFDTKKLWDYVDFKETTLNKGLRAITN